MDALADTCFFIDLQRRANGADSWLEKNSNDRILASVITYGELAAGFTDRKALDERLRGIPVLSIEPAAAWIAGHIFRTLKQAGNTIGANDIWIAAIAINARLPLLTRNQGQFSRINNLTVISY